MNKNKTSLDLLSRVTGTDQSLKVLESLFGPLKQISFTSVTRQTSSSKKGHQMNVKQGLNGDEISFELIYDSN